MKTELLKENWYSFVRVYCKEGYIDRWMGDCFDDPNNENKSRLSGNMSSTCFRLGNGRWYSKRCLGKDFFAELSFLSEDFTASELWKDSFKPDERDLY